MSDRDAPNTPSPASLPPQSPFYAGDMYYASAADAAFWRDQEAKRTSDRATRVRELLGTGFDLTDAGRRLLAAPVASSQRGPRPTTDEIEELDDQRLQLWDRYKAAMAAFRDRDSSIREYLTEDPPTRLFRERHEAKVLADSYSREIFTISARIVALQHVLSSPAGMSRLPIRQAES